MSEFQREERFIVIKRKHMTAVQETALRAHMARLGIGTVECVVVESDWPEYETVWSMIEARCTGATPPPPSQHREPIEADREGAEEWRCFHCGDVFKDRRSARLHFGRDEQSEAACVIKAGAEGSLLKALRDAEEQADDAIQRMHNESTDAALAFHQQRCRHNQALIAAEEAGYEKGLADGRAFSTPAASDAEARDSDRLNFLDECNKRLNAHYGTDYGWELILNHNVNRLMLGPMAVDLNDSCGGKTKLPSCRDAIDKAMARSATPSTEGRNGEDQADG